MVSLTKLPIQLTPDVSKPEITVQTQWPGASPHEVEREIVDEQEEQLKGVEELERMVGESSYDSARIVLRFPAGTNTDTALLRVANRLNQVKEYPEEVNEPVISSEYPWQRYGMVYLRTVGKQSCQYRDYAGLC